MTLTVTDGAGGSATDTVTIVVSDAIASMNDELTRIEEDMRREFRNPAFTIPGSTAAECARALADAIIALQREPKRHLYRELRGGERRRER